MPKLDGVAVKSKLSNCNRMGIGWVQEEVMEISTQIGTQRFKQEVVHQLCTGIDLAGREKDKFDHDWAKGLGHCHPEVVLREVGGEERDVSRRDTMVVSQASYS